MIKMYRCFSNQKILYEIDSYFYCNEIIQNKSEKSNDILGNCYFEEVLKSLREQ